SLRPRVVGCPAPQAFTSAFPRAPPEPLTILYNLGLVLLMFQIGLEFDFSHLTERMNRAAVLRISAVCLALPFECGLAVGLAIPLESPPAARLSTALFVATALSITALPTLG